MKKSIIEKYKNNWVVIGVPHTFREDCLFYYNGNITSLDDETLTIKRGNSEITLNIELIKSIRASPSGGAYEKD